MENLENIIVGQERIKAFLEKILTQKEVYQKCRIPLPNICLQIREGDGRTFLLKTMARIIKKNDLRSFAGLDDYLEYKIDGPLANIIKVFSDLDSHAIYSNGFEGVVGLDISVFSKYVCDEEMKKLFLEKIKQLMETATVVFFLSPGIKNKNQLMKCLEELSLVHIESSYSMYEYAKIMQRYMEEELGIGVLSQERDEITLVLEKWLTEKNEIRKLNVKEVRAIANKLAFHIDCSNLKPTLDLACLKNAGIYCYEENKEVLTNA